MQNAGLYTPRNLKPSGELDSGLGSEASHMKTFDSCRQLEKVSSLVSLSNLHMINLTPLNNPYNIISPTNL